MIGDWVSAKISQSQRQILKVDLFKVGDPFNIWSGYEIQGGYDIEEATPIPLIAEILEKNGFDVYCESEGVFYVKVESESAKIEKWFTYAHELQHALRLCGLHKLADNFKV